MDDAVYATDFDALVGVAERIAPVLRDRGQTVGVAEGSTGGLISAALLAIGGASAYMLGGGIIYTLNASRALLRGPVEIPRGMRGATEEFVVWEAESVAAKLEATWGIGEGGATGPSGNGYGDPAGHGWCAIAGPAPLTRHTLTGGADRRANMYAFAGVALGLFAEALDRAG